MAIPGYKSSAYNKNNASYWKYVQLSTLDTNDAVIELAAFDDPDGPPLLIGTGGKKYIGTLAINAYVNSITWEYYLNGIPPPVMLPPRLYGMKGVLTGIYAASFLVGGATESFLSQPVTISGIPDYSLPGMARSTTNFVLLGVVEVPVNVTAIKYWMKKADGLFYLLDVISSIHYYKPTPDGLGYEEIGSSPLEVV